MLEVLRMDKITAMRADVAVRPDPGEQASDKATFRELIEYAPILMALACLSLVCAVGIMSFTDPKTLPESVAVPKVIGQLVPLQRISLTSCFLVCVVSRGCIGGIASLG